jgi:hypothetical protein
MGYFPGIPYSMTSFEIAYTKGMKNYKGERNGVEFCRGIEWVLFLGVPIK